MDSIWINILGFLICAIAIVFSGIRLAKYGDEIAELTGWGKAWVGLILMASVTSLPELMTGLSAVVFVDAPNLAAGDVLGSCMFNLLILSFIDFRIKKPITSLVKNSHLLAGLFGIILVSIVGYAILTSASTAEILWISPFSMVITIVYIFTIWTIFKFDHNTELIESKSDIEAIEKKTKLKRAVLIYAANAALVIVAGLFLPYFGEHVAKSTGVNNTFFGTLFLAAATSLPELVVSFAAIRIGAFDMVVGNLLGSNIFNIFILALDDVFYTKGSLFANLHKENLESVIMIIIMTAIVGIGIMTKSTAKIWKLGIDSFVILLLYIFLIIALYYK